MRQEIVKQREKELLLQAQRTTFQESVKREREEVERMRSELERVRAEAQKNLERLYELQDKLLKEGDCLRRKWEPGAFLKVISIWLSSHCKGKSLHLILILAKLLLTLLPRKVLVKPGSIAAKPNPVEDEHGIEGERVLRVES